MAEIHLNDYDTILSPVITEKSTLVAEENKIIFRVPLEATKEEIKRAIENLFKVDVTKVNTLRVKGKTKRFRGMMGRRPDFKKAIVTLKDGQSIDISSGL
ncbi:MAG: 50S ribosomal protein L23 [Pseudomonadota bacterium]